jgi:hypothetical protein
VRFTVDPWDPAYGASVEGEPARSEAEVVTDVEVPPARWAPRRPPPEAAVPPVVLFVDGVRRVEARTWVEAGGEVVPGLFASWAAGVVRCDGTARVTDVRVGRGVFAPAPALGGVETRHGVFGATPTTDATPESLVFAVHQQMASCEVEAAEAARRAQRDALVVVDGPLRKRGHVPDAVGYVKSHHVRYLDAPLERVVAALAPGERTPLFRIEGPPFGRASWYARLPGPAGGPWAGVVRCEASGALPVADVVAVADAATAVLPRYASEPHKDGRAPQNLHPIAGLERALRHRLGDAGVVYRALRSASTVSAGAATGNTS